MNPRAHVRVDFSATTSLGPGKVSLLEAIGRTGSLSAAARELGMSYRRAWLLLHSVNGNFREPAVILSVGGAEGGGAKLTPFGTKLIAAYRQLLVEADEVAARLFADLTGEPERVSVTAVPRRPVSRSIQGSPRRGAARKAQRATRA